MTHFEPRRILLVRTDRIGDLLTTTPAIRAVRQAHPDARIELLASSTNAAVARGNPHIDALHVLPRKKPYLWPWLTAQLAVKRFDLAVTFNGSSRTAAWLTRLSGARERVSLEHAKTKTFFTRTVPSLTGSHMVENMLHLAHAVGGTDDDPHMVFAVPPEANRQARERSPRRAELARLGMFIGNAAKEKTRWPAPKFRELARRLTEAHPMEVCVVAGPGDAALLEGFAWNDRLRHYQDSSLQELAAFMTTCDGFVTSSSGPMHLAAAVGVPTVSILAGFTCAAWRPLGDEHRVVLSGDPGVDVRDVSVDAVFAEVSRFLAERADG